jgi:hypothetical protein
MKLRFFVVALLALVLAIFAAGCGGDDDGGDGQDQAATPEATAEATAEGQATATATATAEGDEPAAEGAVPAAIAEQKGLKARGAKETTVDIAVTGLKVDGELATLSLAFTMYGSEDTSDSLFELNGGYRLFVTLVDPVNLKRYMVVTDSDGRELQSDASETYVPQDGTTTAQYTFAAPPPNVTEIDVAVGDWPIFRDVPIER